MICLVLAFLDDYSMRNESLEGYIEEWMEQKLAFAPEPFKYGFMRNCIEAVRDITSNE